jgi:hypothetical protein
MIQGLRPDNPVRKELTPLMHLIGEAYRVSLFNRTMGTNLTTLVDLPIDYVAAIIAWGEHQSAG